MNRPEALYLFALLLRWDHLDDYFAGALLDGEDHRDIAAEMDDIERELADAGIDNPDAVLAEMKARGIA